MSGQTWIPPNIADICPEQHASLTQCSPTGYMFLALLTQLYGSSKMSVTPDNDWQDSNDAFRSKIPHFGSESYLSQTPIRHIPFNSEISPGLSLGTNFHDDHSSKYSTKVHSHGPGPSQGYSHAPYFPNFEFEKEFSKTDPFHEGYRNPFSKYTYPNYNYNSVKRSFSDIDAADSKIVPVKEEKKKVEKRRRKRQALETYDFIVVGAGSAGCVIANRLSEVKDWKVLLLEAGPEEPDVTSVPAFAPTLGRSNIDWMYRTQPEEMTCRAQRGQTCAWLSGRVMGGSSATNYMVYMRGNKRDYDEWAELGNVGWSYREVLPYFKKSENNQDIEAKDQYHHGVDGPLNVERFSYADKNIVMLVESFREKGFPYVDFNGYQQIGTMVTQTTSKNGERVSANVAFLAPIRHNRPNLTIITNAQVTKVLIDKNKRAFGVEYVKDCDWHEARASKEIILSAGALNSPKILMLSGIGPKTELENLGITSIKDLKVGYNLQDHATTEAVIIKLTNKTSTLLPAKQMLNKIKNYYKSGTEYDPLAATGILHMTAFHRTKYADEDPTVPDIQFHFDGRNVRDFYSDPTTYLATAIFPFSYYDGINVRPVLVHPESRGILTLNKTDPIFGQPLIYPRFFTIQRDLDTLVAALKFSTKLEDTQSFKENGAKFVRKPVEACKQYPWGSYKYFACAITRYTGTIFHPSGTCKMGPECDKDAVVDPRLKVFGIDRLRVADASIMPHIVRGNTNAPCMMIGEKVADMIKQDWNILY